MRILVGLVCDTSVAPATMAAVGQGLMELATADHAVEFRVEAAAGNPDVARSMLATAAVSGRFALLVLIDSGVSFRRGAMTELCDVAARRAMIAGADVPPFSGNLVGASLTVYPVARLAEACSRLPATDQSWWPFFVGEVTEVEGRRCYIPGAWALCRSFGGALLVHGLEARWSISGTSTPKRGRSPVVEVKYPEPRLPVDRYLEELARVAEVVRPAASSSESAALTEPPPMPAMPVRRLDRRIRVTLVNTCMLAGGAERQTCTIACGLDRARFDPVVVNTQPELGAHKPLLDLLAAADVPCVAGDCHPAIDQADVVLWWGPALRRRLLSGGPVRGSLHVAHSDSHWTAESIVACEKRIDRVVAVSGPAAAMVADVLGRPRGSVPVIWNGIDPAEFSGARPDRSAAPFTLGYLGRLSAEKNPVAIVRALAMLPGDVRLKIWGAGPLEAFLRDAVAELGLQPRVDFCGVANDRAAAFEQMDAMVLASLFEGLPLTVLEAMLARVPVITPPWGDLPLVLGSPRAGQMERRGFLADPDARGIADAVELLQELGGIPEMVERARSFALEHFTADRMVAAYSALFEQIAAEQ